MFCTLHYLWTDWLSVALGNDSSALCVCLAQTGSGKTFTITGGAERYTDRGIIPRTLSYIFDYQAKVMLHPSIQLHEHGTEWRKSEVCAHDIFNLYDKAKRVKYCNTCYRTLTVNSPHLCPILRSTMRMAMTFLTLNMKQLNWRTFRESLLHIYTYNWPASQGL